MQLTMLRPLLRASPRATCELSPLAVMLKLDITSQLDHGRSEVQVLAPAMLTPFKICVFIKTRKFFAKDSLGKQQVILLAHDIL